MTELNDAIGTGIGLGVGLAVTGSLLTKFDKLGRPVRRRKIRRRKRK